MAKTLSNMRTGEGQVIPDTTLNRRMDIPFSVGVPVDQAKRTYPLMGRNSVLNQVEISLVFDPKSSKIFLAYDKPIFTINLEKKESKKMKRFILFSDASKMGCPSFSLPAGPPREGGTCAAAGIRAKSMNRPSRGTSPGGARRDKQGNVFVCDNCYATSGNYWYASTTLAQAARLKWLTDHLKSDPSGASLAADLTWAIDTIAKQATLKNLSNRMGMEIGVWNGTDIVVPGYIRHRGASKIPLLPTSLPTWSGFRNTRDYFQSLQPPEGAVTGFFRIHDSGDLNVGKTAASLAYLNAWTRVARAFPYVIFWLPVRAFQNNKTIREALQAAAAAAPNFVIRASPLFVNSPPADIPGLSASGVHSKGRLAEGHYDCPAGASEEKSCMSGGCRVCWMFKDMIPSYEEH